MKFALVYCCVVTVSPMDWSKVDKQEGDFCWVWLGRVDNGHPQAGSGRGRYQVARHVYEECVGPIPAGMQVRHGCGNNMCVRPDHLSAGLNDRMHAERTKERFLKCVKKRGPHMCWPWTGRLSHNGYGRVYDGRRALPVTHYAWKLHTGQKVPSGKIIMHTCDNPPCCNPAHLRLGTQAENVADRDRKGRTCRGDDHWQRKYPDRRLRGDKNPMHLHPEKAARGSRNGNSKLDDDTVRSIKQLREAGWSQQCIADKIGIGQSAVSNILLGHTWKHVR